MTQANGAANAIRIHKKYKLLRFLSLVPLLAVVVILYVEKELSILSGFLLPALVAFNFLFTIFCARWYTNAIRNALLQELDLAEYNARITALKWNTHSCVDIILSAYAAGDHQRILDVIHPLLVTTKNKALRYTWLSWLSLSQFITGSREQLARILDEMEHLAKENRGAAKLFKKDLFFKFFIVL